MLETGVVVEICSLPALLASRLLRLRAKKNNYQEKAQRKLDLHTQLRERRLMSYAKRARLLRCMPIVPRLWARKISIVVEANEEKSLRLPNISMLTRDVWIWNANPPHSLCFSVLEQGGQAGLVNAQVNKNELDNKQKCWDFWWGLNVNDVKVKIFFLFQWKFVGGALWPLQFRHQRKKSQHLGWRC